MLAMGFNFSTVDGAIGAWAIRHATGGDYNHVSVRFVGEHPESGTPIEEYFESGWKPDPKSGRSGVRGPFPLRDLRQWEIESPRHHVYYQPLLPLKSAEAEAAYTLALSWVGAVGYDPLGLVRLELLLRFGLQFSRRRTGTPGEMQCAEFAFRLLPARLWPEFGVPDRLADHMFPSGGRGDILGLLELANDLGRGGME